MKKIQLLPKYFEDLKEKDEQMKFWKENPISSEEKEAQLKMRFREAKSPTKISEEKKK